MGRAGHGRWGVGVGASARPFNSSTVAPVSCRERLHYSGGQACVLGLDLPDHRSFPGPPLQLLLGRGGRARLGLMTFYHHYPVGSSGAQLQGAVQSASANEYVFEL